MTSTIMNARYNMKNFLDDWKAANTFALAA
jgi:hypothetical protein